MRRLLTTPALWMPEISAATVIIGAAPHPIAEPLALDLKRLGDIVADRVPSDGRHIIVAGPHCKHRIWMSGECCKDGFVVVVPADKGFAVRMAATRSLERHLRGFPDSDPPAELGLTARRHRKMALMLRLIVADHAHITRREMAFTLVYPRLDPLAGPAWKCSSERRRTQRLIDEAIGMMHGGYRALLQG